MLKALTVEQIRKIINTAEEFNSKKANEHGSSTVVDGSSITLREIQSYMDDERPLAHEIEALSYSARTELIALMWVGGGSEDDFHEALRHAYEKRTDIDYVLGKSLLLPNYLRNGMKKIGPL
jgi:Protein of unknown function (DUF3775)